MMHRVLLVLSIFFAVQGYSLSDSLKTRNWKTHVVPIAGFSVSQTLLSLAWYQNYEQQAFHLFNDLPEWKGMDKIGHAWSAYHLQKFFTQYFVNRNYSEEKSSALAFLYAQSYLLGIEVLDAFSAKWGFSPFDLAANFIGGGLAVLERKTNQDFDFYLGFKPFYSNNPQLKKRRENLFGSSVPEQLLKDYNQQTYWLAYYPSIQPSNWVKLGVGIGVGANNLFGGRENKWKSQGVSYDFSSKDRTLEWYVAPTYKFNIPLFRISGINWMIKLPGPVFLIDNRSIRITIR